MKELLLISGLSVLAACGTTAPATQQAAAQQSCEGVICTRMFAMVGVEVRDAAGKPVQLDDAYTLVSKSGQRIPMEQQGTDGHYTVLNDSYQKQLQNRTDQFRFVGMKNGAKVVDEPYTISADCCHVKKVEGKEVVVLQ